jgi:hypothetical protein
LIYSSRLQLLYDSSNIAEDDFSPAGKLEYKPASVNRKETDFKEVAQRLALAQKLIAQVMKELDKAKKNQR